MAFWVVGGNGPPAQCSYDQHGKYPDFDDCSPLLDRASLGTKRRMMYLDEDAHGRYDDGYDYKYKTVKRLRLEDWRTSVDQQAYHQPQQHRRLQRSSPPASVPVKNLAFLVIREGTQSPDEHHAHHEHEHRRHYHYQDLHRRNSPPTYPRPRTDSPRPLHHHHHAPSRTPIHNSSAAMERTESGLSISSDTTTHSTSSATSFTSHIQENDLKFDLPPLTDLEAANLVLHHISSSSHRHPDSQPSRILRSLISPRITSSASSSSRAFTLDDAALHSLFRAANALFFAGRLSRRVTWDWSHASSSPRYSNHIVGTTAVRPSTTPGISGFETLIVLSAPLLRDSGPTYNRRLLIATFLHEMIHSFLFITCGSSAAVDAARNSGGHTEGFRIIAKAIDDWVGRDHLRLADIKADLARFRHGDVDDGESGSCMGHGGHALDNPRWRTGCGGC